MVLLFKETKCILESDFKACIDLHCSFTTEIDSNTLCMSINSLTAYSLNTVLRNSV